MDRDRHDRDTRCQTKPAASAHAELSAELECRADQFSSGGPLRHQGRRAFAAWICCAGALFLIWAKDIKVGFSNINAKAEGIETKPAFREAFQRRRCLVPVDDFYEWAKTEDRQAALRDRAGRPEA